MKNRTGELTNAEGSVEYQNGIPNAPAAAPFFSQVVWAGDTAYLAGQIALDAATKKLVEGGITAETEKTFDNMEAVLHGAGLTIKDVAKISVYLTNISELPAFNEIYQRRLGKARPAREMIEVKSLAFGAKVELTITAYRASAIQNK